MTELHFPDKIDKTVKLNHIINMLTKFQIRPDRAGVAHEVKRAAADRVPHPDQRHHHDARRPRLPHAPQERVHARRTPRRSRCKIPESRIFLDFFTS